MGEGLGESEMEELVGYRNEVDEEMTGFDSRYSIRYTTRQYNTIQYNTISNLHSAAVGLQLVQKR